MKRIAFILLSVITVLPLFAEGINRHEVVSRHDIGTDHTLGRSPAQVGNGRFAFGMDITGLQTFTPFNTLSDWGWHSVPLPEGKSMEDYDPVTINSYGKDIPYILDDPEDPEISGWLKWNPHRVHLGRIGFILLKEDGAQAIEQDLYGTKQNVDLWTGLVSSTFTIEGKTVEVKTSCHSKRDVIGVEIRSELITEGRIKIFFDFPYANDKGFTAFVGDYDADGLHESSFRQVRKKLVSITHNMDDLTYNVNVSWDGEAEFSHKEGHMYVLSPSEGKRLSFTADFRKEGPCHRNCAAKVEKSQRNGWKKFWTSGAAVDFSGSRDPRWVELERRVVLSQYLMRLNESGLLPPQEEGLVNNGWHGRFHWEMIWWHGAHWALWNRQQYCGYLETYNKFMPEAVERAKSEGRRGAKWPKCTGDFNREWPCAPHAMLCWQQPHPIWFAEMDWRTKPSQKTLDKWKDVVVATADYMADYVFWDETRQEYVIGPPVVAVSENTDPLTTVNPVFELSYFRYGLRTALAWAERLGMTAERTQKWKNVLEKLSPLPIEDGCYKTAESMQNMWTDFNFEHPALTGIFGWLPGDGVDREIFHDTFYKVMDKWQMDRIWGWDYPMMAMAAARLGDPETAVNLLTCTEHKFNFDAHGLADTWPFPYFPANGGLLSATAMMCGGWDEGPDVPAPGFPQDGNWTVKFEGFNRMQ